MMKKLTFDELENTLDREEMRNIMAGSGSGCDCGTAPGCNWDGCSMLGVILVIYQASYE